MVGNIVRIAIVGIICFAVVFQILTATSREKIDETEDSFFEGQAYHRNADGQTLTRLQSKGGAIQSNHIFQNKLARTKAELESHKKQMEAIEADNLNAQKELVQQKESLEKELTAAKKELGALKKANDDSEAEASQESAQITESHTVAPCKPLEWHAPPEGTTPDLQQIWDITMPWCNTTIAALYKKKYFAGLQNQIMSFTGLVMFSLKDGHSQILLETLRHRDTYGSGKLAPHEALFDVAHWNSFYPELPRMVHCDPGIMLDYNCSTGVFDWKEYNMPFAYKTFGNQHFTAYSRYTKQKGALASPFPNPADLLIKAGALRPHPDLRAIANRLMSSMGDNDATPLSYMTVHARIEPDMQKHPVCKDKKVLNLTTIVDFLETEWKDPPATKIFFPINRQYLELEGVLDYYKPGEEINWIAVNNLRELNRIGEEGLWNGRAKIFEFGANALKGSRYERQMSSIGGALLNFYIATNADIFVGTEISSYSSDLVGTRFHRGNLNNYFYLPDGLHQATTKEDSMPPAFEC